MSHTFTIVSSLVVCTKVRTKKIKMGSRNRPLGNGTDRPLTVFLMSNSESALREKGVEELTTNRNTSRQK